MKKERGKGELRTIRKRERGVTATEGTMTLDETESTSGIESANRKGNFVRQKTCERRRKKQK